MKTICVISARGGSRGVPGKNIRIINGKPLIVWSIEQALATKEIDRVVVSTDSEEIANGAVDGLIDPLLTGRVFAKKRHS